MAKKISKNSITNLTDNEGLTLSKISASAFDGDDRHFDTSLAIDETKRGVDQNGKCQLERIEISPKFGTSTLSKSAPIGGTVAVATSEKLNDEDCNECASTERVSEVLSSEKSHELKTSNKSFDIPDISSSSGNWVKFAQAYFQTKGTYSFSCLKLQQPLLQKRDKADHLASLASWVTILRIMGDLPDADVGDNLAVAGTAPTVVTTVREYFQRKYTKRDVDDAQKRYSELFKDPVHSGISNVPFLPNRSGAMLDKVQYVTALGIYRPEIRDELYCQVCRQLTNNPSRNSILRGWVLLSLFAGSFAPTETFSPFLLQFLKDSSPVFAEKIERLIRRTFLSGTRGFPPSWLEFQAAKNGKPILIPVALMNNHRILITADSVTSVQELCHQICDRLGITDVSGFSIYITLMQRISCLGHGLHRIMDAVAECEQNTKQMGMRESSSAWRLYFRKEYFVPWYNANLDEISTELIYHQVMRGISVGEYKCDKEEILILMGAKRYLCESHDSCEPLKLTAFLKSWLPEESLQAKEIGYWEDRVTNVLKKDYPEGQNFTVDNLRVDIVTYAKDKWNSQFSRFYDASKILLPTMTLQNGIVGVNSRQVDIMDEKEESHAHLSFLMISSITRTRHSTIIVGLNGDEYIIYSNHSEDLHSHLVKFFGGLKLKSKFALVVQDSAHYENSLDMNAAKGDVVVLNEPYEKRIDADLMTGTCQRTGKLIVMPRDLLYVLPTTKEPSDNEMAEIAVQVKRDSSIFTDIMVKERKQHTLEEYSKIHFRSGSDTAVTKVLKQVSFRKEKTPEIWQFSKETMRKPILRKTMLKEELRVQSCKCFQSIQQYMCDSANPEKLEDAVLANDFVIDPAIRNRHLREEVYCQLIKQLTNNPEKTSIDRGFKLLRHLTSAVIPSYEMTQQCEAFLKGSKHILANICLENIYRTRENGCRIYPPHMMEHHSSFQSVSVNILFPSGRHQIFDILPTLRVGELRNVIANKLGLAVAEDYSVFFGLEDRGGDTFFPSLALLISAKETEYFMDSLTHVEQFWLQPDVHPSTNESNKKRNSKLTIFFMKKLWVDAIPGEEIAADINFHFPQEVPNYLRGYHKCKEDEVVKLGSMLYIAQHGSDLTQLRNIEENTSFFIPAPMLKEKSGREWKQLIESYVQKVGVRTGDEAKIEFLRLLFTLSTYGSVFFEVKQRSVKTFPKNILLAVNKDGIIFLDSINKGIIAKYGYKNIPNWAYDENSFTLVVGESSNAVKIYMETNLGHNLDDIVMCYVAWMMNKHIKKRPSAAGVTVGESTC